MPFSGLSRSDPGGVWLLPQVDFRASTAEPDFVHHGAHQEDAAAVSCGLLFWSGGIYKGLRIEARAVVTNGDVDIYCWLNSGSPGSVQQTSAPEPQPAIVTGTVLDMNGGLVAGAAVELSPANPSDRRTIWRGANGAFKIETGIRLRLATVRVSVVAITPEQAAIEQVRVQETQRIAEQSQSVAAFCRERGLWNFQFFALSSKIDV